MEKLSSFRGDKHEFCLVVIKFKHASSDLAGGGNSKVQLSIMCQVVFDILIAF